MAVRVDSVARPTRCWPYVARHIARHSYPPLLRVPPPLPFRAPLPPVSPPWRAPWFYPVVGGCVATQGGGGGATLALVPPSGSFPTGGAMHALPVRVLLCCTGRPFVSAPYKWTCAVTRYVGPSPHRGWVHCGSLGSPCGIGASLAYPDGRCALPAAPHRTRTAVRAVGSALGQAHWPPPQAGATSGRWPTVPGVTHLIACAQVGPIRTPGGPPNP